MAHTCVHTHTGKCTYWNGWRLLIMSAAPSVHRTASFSSYQTGLSRNSLLRILKALKSLYHTNHEHRYTRCRVFFSSSSNHHHHSNHTHHQPSFLLSLLPCGIAQFGSTLYRAHQIHHQKIFLVSDIYLHHQNNSSFENTVATFFISTFITSHII